MVFLPNGISVYNLQLTRAGGNIVLSFRRASLAVERVKFLSMVKEYKNAQLSPTNPRDAKPCQKLSSSTWKQVTDNNNLFEAMEIRCLEIKFLIQITSTYSSYSTI